MSYQSNFDVNKPIIRGEGHDQNPLEPRALNNKKVKYLKNKSVWTSRIITISVIAAAIFTVGIAYGIIVYLALGEQKWNEIWEEAWEEAWHKDKKIVVLDSKDVSSHAIRNTCSQVRVLFKSQPNRDAYPSRHDSMNHKRGSRSSEDTIFEESHQNQDNESLAEQSFNLYQPSHLALIEGIEDENNFGEEASSSNSLDSSDTAFTAQDIRLEDKDVGSSIQNRIKNLRDNILVKDLLLHFNRNDESSFASDFVLNLKKLVESQASEKDLSALYKKYEDQIDDLLKKDFTEIQKLIEVSTKMAISENKNIALLANKFKADQKVNRLLRKQKFIHVLGPLLRLSIANMPAAALKLDWEGIREQKQIIQELLDADEEQFNTLIYKYMDQFVLDQIHERMNDMSSWLGEKEKERGGYLYSVPEANFTKGLNALFKLFKLDKSQKIYELYANFESNVEAKNAFYAIVDIMANLSSKLDDKGFENLFKEYFNKEVAIRESIEKLNQKLESNPSAKDIKEIVKDLLKNISVDKNNKAKFTTLIKLMKELINKEGSKKAYLNLCNNRNRNETEQECFVFFNEYLGYNNNLNLAKILDIGQNLLNSSDALKVKYLSMGLTLSDKLDDKVTLDVVNAISNCIKLIETSALTKEKLLDLEIFASFSQASYILAYNLKPYPRLIDIIKTLGGMKISIERKLQEFSDVKALRQQTNYQKFCKALTQLIKEKSGYESKRFWVDDGFADVLKMDDEVIDLIGAKLRDPDADLSSHAKQIYSNKAMGYSIHIQPTIEGQKAKLLIFVDRDDKHAVFSQSINYQLSLLGDTNILKASEDIFNNIQGLEALNVLVGELAQGNIELIVSGFSFGGAVATVVAQQIAATYPRMTVKSIAAGSSSIVTTEDAYLMNSTSNFYPIRLRYGRDGNIQRTIGGTFVDFSENTYHTFPLMVQNKAHTANLICHNRIEYGNADNFPLAMKLPIMLRGLYKEFAGHIVIDTGKEKELIETKNEDKDEDLLCSLIQSNGKVTLVGVEAFDDLITFGLNNNSIPASNDQSVLKDIRNLYEIIELLQPQINTGEKINLTEQQIKSLMIGINRKFELFACNIYGQICSGNNYELYSLLEILSQLLKNQWSLDLLESSVDNFGVGFKLLMDEKNSLVRSCLNEFFDTDVLDRVDFEDNFLEYVCFKIAIESEDKHKLESEVITLVKDEKNEFEIALYTSKNKEKKQRLVIHCKGPDTGIGSHANTYSKNFGAGELNIIKRAETQLLPLVIKQLNQFYEEYTVNKDGQKDFEIVVNGYGVEGSVATVLGYSLAKEYEHQEVRSIGFAAPPFATGNSSELTKKQPNFIPLRFLILGYKRYDLSTFNPLNYSLNDKDSYYTIPLHTRARSFGNFLGLHDKNIYGDALAVKSSIKLVRQLREIYLGKREPVVHRAKFRRAVDQNMIDLKNLAIIDKKSLKKISPNKLIRIMKFCSALSQDELSNEQKKMICQFFQTFIQAIKNTNIYEDQKVTNSFYKKMLDYGYAPETYFGRSEGLQRIISPSLNDAIDKLSLYRDDNKMHSECALRVSYEKGLLVANLKGNRYKPAGGGVNGALFFQDFDGKFLGVFKPHPETMKKMRGTLDLQNWAELTKKWVGMDAHLNKKDPNARVNNELFAYELFSIFGFNQHGIEFPTTIKIASNLNDPKIPASFCAFISGYKLAKAHLKDVLNAKKSSFTENELSIWQLSKIFDFLTGNLDGHPGNAFVKVGENGVLVGAANFDYDKAFAADEKYKCDNQYQWAKLRISQYPLTDKTKEILDKMLKDFDSKIKAFVDFTKSYGENSFVKSQEDLLKRRIAVLQQLITSNANLSTLIEKVETPSL